MLRIVGIATALAWLVLLLAPFATAGPKRVVTFDSPAELIGDAVLLVIAAIVAASAYFAYRPQLWLGALLGVVSLGLALLFCYGIWVHISLLGSDYLSMLRFSHHFWFQLSGALVFVTLSILWVAVWRRLRARESRT
jgi:hypothetical protein